MIANWYYIEDDETVGPTTFEDLSKQVRRTGRSCLVWTEGMSEWTEAETVPALSQLFRGASPNPAQASGRSDPGPGAASKSSAIKNRLWREFTEYLMISAYLFVCFGSLLFYKAAILHSDGIEFAPLGIAAVKALVLGKFVLILHALKIGEKAGDATVLLTDILKKSVLFLLFLSALSVAEEILVGYLHGRQIMETISEVGGGTLQQAFATSILMLLILIPYFTFRVVAVRLGEGVLWKLLTERSAPASP
jgi:hypothetical protein